MSRLGTLDNVECGGYYFSSNFDSGNLAHVELASNNEDIEFNLWTRPDCAGTQYENQNRTWFYFGINGGSSLHTKIAKLNIMNMNRQAKLYSQGMQPVQKVGDTGKWERIKDKPTYYIENDSFVMSFVHRPQNNNNNTQTTTFYAFTFPYTYNDLQTNLEQLDKRFCRQSNEIQLIINKMKSSGEIIAHNEMICDNLPITRTKVPVTVEKVNETEVIPSASETSFQLDTDICDQIYYYRENLVNSVEGRRIDLLTITSFDGIQEKREDRLVELFPDKEHPRCHTFKDKKIIFFSARVHPGETPSSFVLNGFLQMIVDRKHEIGIVLRKKYVFKIVPFLNPDGVYNGHYRSDTLGYNLNRVYLNPSLQKHPSIYAVRKLIRFYHYGYDRPETSIEIEMARQASDVEVPESKNTKVVALKEVIEKQIEKAQPLQYNDDINKNSRIPVSEPSYLPSSSVEHKPMDVSPPPAIKLLEPTQKWLAVAKVGGASAIPILAKSKSDLKVGRPLSAKAAFTPSSVRKEYKNRTISPPPIFGHYRSNLRRTMINSAQPIDLAGIASDWHSVDNSRMFLYIDMHGHASKKGVFMYGNHLPDPSEVIECMLLPKLLSMNSHHFHFDGCNFSERNMYYRGKRDGLSKEGSGRVAIYKTIGLLRAYTLEGNYNTGKFVNVLPPLRGKEGLVKPVNLVPPKYTPAVFEEVGRALGSSILDLTGSNSTSRIYNSEFHTLQGLRQALKLEIDRSLVKTAVMAGSRLVTGKLRTKRVKTSALLSGVPAQAEPLALGDAAKLSSTTIPVWESKTSAHKIPISKVVAANRKVVVKSQNFTTFGKKDSARKLKGKAILMNCEVSATAEKEKSVGQVVPRKRFKVVIKPIPVATVTAESSLPSDVNVTSVSGQSGSSPSSASPCISPSDSKELTSFFSTESSITQSDTADMPSTSDSSSLIGSLLQQAKVILTTTKLKKPILLASGSLQKPTKIGGNTTIGMASKKTSTELKLKKKRTLKSDSSIKRKKSRVKTVWH